MNKEVNEERAPQTVTDVKEMLTKHSNGEIQRTSFRQISRDTKGKVCWIISKNSDPWYFWMKVTVCWSAGRR